ncbi:MAG: hypothetical protein QE485_13695 [Acidovorax sp.]|uniref:hypothetical protein n=1 Tax=Acidovorax sp. TaxID=1872122 RepID=UPI00261BEC7A|nr:hypothetical protein [Acidovorax sp.]MDH4418271.1 hypothetical protein [Acidovorax sp.]
MTEPKAFNIPRRCYELIGPKDVQTCLVTRNVNFCTAFIGVSKADGLVFMCHLDMPTTANALGELVALIRGENGSLADFELYALSMFPPCMRFFGILLLSWFVHVIAGPAIAAACFALLTWFSSWAQFKCYWAARNYFHARIKWIMPSGFAGIFRTMGVAVDTTTQKVVDVWWDEKGINMTPWLPKLCRLKAVRVRKDVGAKERF